MDETECVKALIAETSTLKRHHRAIAKRASLLIEEARKKKPTFGVESFLSEYGLSSKEGITIMCLAEALLRIPDTATADALIHDKFTGTKWEAHLGNSPSLLVNASSWGLLLTGKVINLDHARSSLGQLVGGLVAKAGEPIIRAALKKAMHILGTEFVLGETISSALHHATTYARKGYMFSYDVLGEGARSTHQACTYYDGYMEAIASISLATDHALPLYHRPSISVKLSALHPRYELVKYARLREELLPKLKKIFVHAMEKGLCVTLDAEESSRLDLSLLLFAEVLSDPRFNGYNGFGLAVQAYQKRALPVLTFIQNLAEQLGRRIPVRLVKGAYWDSEIKKAQHLGLEGYPVFTRKPYTDLSYLACARTLLAHPQQFYPQFATHNAYTISSIMEMAGEKEYEFQRLHGMGEAIYTHLLMTEQVRCRIYAPIGAHVDLLSYLIRRLLENGANTSFVHLLADNATPMTVLTRDPIAETEHLKCEPSPSIPLPEKIIPARQNPLGIDTGNLAQLLSMHKHLQHHSLKPLPAESTNEAMDSALNRTSQAFPEWAAQHPFHRTAILKKTADLFDRHRNELISLCMQEGSKTLGDSISEIREAIDFLRYYAGEAEQHLLPKRLASITGETNELTLHGRGVFFCISPWNFPLAIFTGQIAAALVTGNCVIAKPAEQTPRIAMWAVQFMHEAGIPEDVLTLLIGDGATIGHRIISDPRIAGVVFTGSTETAQLINRQLANRGDAIVPLIAETGGQNAMIVDSSALLEHAVDDIISSAFGSTGQRCSALRVLFIQEEIAAPLIRLLADSMLEIAAGNPLEFSTDIGPVIDDTAYAMLSSHSDHMHKTAKVIYAPPLTKASRIIPPQIFEIDHLSDLSKEVFGPILHVIRYKAEELDSVIDAINATGYGLTFGVHSRIEEKVTLLRSRIHAGNMYVNRSMIGAVVGMQPFGGEGLSGTGPKAGGPHYLLRFCKERTLTVNTAAVGGNVELYSSGE